MVKTIEQKYKELTETEHVLSRPNMYVGSIKPELSTMFVFDYNEQIMVQKEVEYVPAILKLIDEVISNSCDEYRRSDNLGLTQVSVTVLKDDTIVREDSGGIPVVKHKDAGVMLPRFIFGRLRTSSNYNDDEDRAGLGQNGIGASLTTIFSSYLP